MPLVAKTALPVAVVRLTVFLQEVKLLCFPITLAFLTWKSLLQIFLSLSQEAIFKLDPHSDSSYWPLGSQTLACMEQ